MHGFPIGRRFAALAILAAFVTPAAAEPRPTDALAVPDPAEIAAPADATFATACQTGARERFDQERPTFGRTSHTALGDTRILRMDLTVAGEPFRAVCTRERAGGAVETVVFAGPADETGPRVIVLGGTPAPVRAVAEPTGAHFIVRDPRSGAGDSDIVYGGGYGGGYLPGLWGPDANTWNRSFARRTCVGCRTVVVNGTRVVVTQNGTVVAVVRTTPQFVGRFPGSSAPFSGGGMASPGISNFPAATPRMGAFRSGVIGRSGSFHR